MTIIKQWMLVIFLAVAFQNLYANKPFFGSMGPIPQNIKKLMIGVSWHEGCPVSLDELAYLKLPYWGFDNKPHEGELIINKILAKETVSIFKKLFELHFPIEKMMLPEHLGVNRKFNNTTELAFFSDNSNNTNAFFCRSDGQDLKKFSPHSWGIAIDINPFYNPAIISQQYMHLQKGLKFLNRTLQHIGMIRPTGDPVNIFLNHGWRWGGFNKEEPDYMHFQKMIVGYYLINNMEFINEGSSLLAPEISKF